MVTVRLLPFGERAVLAELDALADVLELRVRLSESRPAGVIDVVPAARSVLVRIDPGRLSVAGARAWIAHAATATAPIQDAAPGDALEVRTVYDGDDLAEVAAALGCSADEVVRRHAAAAWTVAFTGFAPGFGYLVSSDWPWTVPRRESPRTRVPAGSVAVAGEFTGAYPRETPGGWQIVGRTSETLFDPTAQRPALLVPGARVRFVPTRPEIAAAPPTATAPPPAAATSAPPAAAAPPATTTAPPTAPPAAPPAATTAPPAAARARASAPAGGGEATALRILQPGLQATIQDQGRPGHAAEGIAVSGAADRAALRTGNRLVGNDERAAGVEIALGGLRAVALRDLWFAVTGAWGPVTLDGRPVDPYAAHVWGAGTELEIGWFTHGARAYLAVRGGLDAAVTAGSRATDTLAGIGPAPLAAGDELPLARDAVHPVPPEDLHPWGPPHDELLEVALAPGPRADWFTSDALTTLFEAVWTVSNDVDRVGIRLDGPVLARAVTGELSSEGMVPGALQVPPSGRPVVLGPDGPVTGGYPVIAVVADADRDVLAQARPATRVRFRHAR